MKKLFPAILGLVLAISMGAPVWAQVGTPVPAPPDLGGTAPPSIPDLNEIELPPLPASSPAAPAPTTSIEEAPIPQPAAKMTPTPPSAPAPPPPPMPTPTKVSAVHAAVQSAPAPPPAPPSASAAAASVPLAGAASSVSTGGISDYFPWTQGQSLNYEYLKPAAGSTTKRTRVVECLEDAAMANGTVHFTLKTTEGAQVVQDKYSLYDNKVEHTFAGKMALAGHVVLQLPATGQSLEWQLKGGDGLTHAYKAFFGKAQVYQKVYPDCVIVIDKGLQGTKPVSTRIDYYAKGIGLVAVETYAPGMKLIQSESLALVESGH
jgi:hypothetical protein